MQVDDAVQPEGEWRLEQGMAPADLPIRDQSLRQQTSSPASKPSAKEGTDDREAAASIDPDVEFAEEHKGWRGYIEWENYPEKKAKAAAILKRHTFPPPPEFQLSPIPATNPVLEGVRWKMWHKALGGPLTSIPEESWLRVIQEKHRDMLHLLQFPYNGEPPKTYSVS